MILLMTFSSLNPWVSRESLNLISGQKGQLGFSLLLFVGVWVLLSDAVQPSGQRRWAVAHVLFRVLLFVLVHSPWLG